MHKKAIIVESLEGWHLPFIQWYLWRNYDVYYLNPCSVDSTRKSIHRLQTAQRIEYLKLPEPLEVNNDPAHDLAFEATDTLYDRFFREQSPFVRRMLRLYQSEDIHLAFKKQLLFELSEYFHCRLLQDQLQRLLPDVDKLIFIPHHSTDALVVSRYETALRNSGETERIGASEIEFPSWLRLLGTLILVLSKLKAAALCTYTIISAVYKYVCTLGKSTVPQVYDFGIAVVSPSREFANDIRGSDFLLDGKGIRRDNTIFVPIVRLSKRDIELLEKKGLTVSNHVGAAPHLETKEILFNGVWIMARMVLAPAWIARVAANLVSVYWTWTAFLSRYAIEQFITYADFSVRQIGRNILLKRRGVQTWYYLDTENLGALNFTNSESTSRRHQFWGYLYYDKFVAWSQRVVRYHRGHKQKVGEYVAVGCIWSEHIRLLREGEIPSRFRDVLTTEGYSPRQKLIAVFDSGYNNLSHTNYQDGAAFAQAIEKLLEEFSDIFVVWKEKKSRSFHRGKDTFGLLSLYGRLSSHPRCYFSGYDIASAEIIASCDLTISFPFTSPTIEALGARVKAIYYIPDEKFGGSYFEKIPDLVACNYPELHDKVKTLLYYTTPEEYDRYLERCVRGQIESYLDGEALTRFRLLLTEA